MNKDLAKISKFLSYVLRHKPESIGITLDENGWVMIADLIAASEKSGQALSRETLDQVVSTNDKQRFAISPDGLKIRANQGHSVANIELNLKAQTPPEILYHGTVEKFLAQIEQSGIKKMSRQHVHLSATMDTAENVGSRRGSPIVLTIDSATMQKDGYLFYLSENGVWLTEEIPFQYITIK